MTTRQIIGAVGMIAIAAVCFFPPQRDVQVDGISIYMTKKATDYYKLATWVTGIAALTGAAFFIAGPRRRIVDAHSGEVVAR